MIHKFTSDNVNVVIDVNSGAVHVVDKIVHDLLDYYPKHSQEEIIDKIGNLYSTKDIKEAINEIDTLTKEGLLFSKERYIEHFDKHKGDPVIKALCLHIAHDCNIRCQYCFASQGDFEGQRSFMSSEIGKKAIDFLLENSGSRRNLEVDFFGGEPLMNFNVVKEIVDYGKAKEQQYNKNIRFTITTNGLLLDDENMDYINNQMHNVVLSLDGRKETNDKMRYTINGGGTYDHIVPKLQKMVKLRKGKNYYVRGTFTKHNKNFAQDVLHLADLGFQNISVEPVVAGPEHDYAIAKEDLQLINDQYDYLAKEMTKRNGSKSAFNFFHFNIDLNQGPCVIKRLLGCGAGAEYLAVTPEGDLYPCHQFVGNKKFLIGNIIDSSVDTTLYNYFQEANVYNKEKCDECWAKFYCSGGCHANAYNFNDDIYKPYDIGCEMEKKRIECAIMIKAKEAN
ncbi:thioether cross-link-forming SCIFF peptide maturase [Serpentinicella sp. ANB-PHB4]|uniref:thioether cross-link-forming SCIFF peptide maturase n=1 Tax=Serpentinicella sp. ANB-PHB4 TaxID=3074076 RepID=UPI00285AF942|nr:thioether cross-link-forming SCIFF peptide maturase [Serpentinicella sp. ANB-PHB4]MDR5658063.1 thioether cross-link-forming SCIFF peptide maturase [Serpentinicella sp. ANB-PHB4]